MASWERRNGARTLSVSSADMGMHGIIMGPMGTQKGVGDLLDIHDLFILVQCLLDEWAPLAAKTPVVQEHINPAIPTHELVVLVPQIRLLRLTKAATPLADAQNDTHLSFRYSSSS